MNKLSRLLVGAAVSATLVAGGGGIAQAATLAPQASASEQTSSPSTATQADIETMVTGLQSSNLPRTESGATTTYTLDSGVKLDVVKTPAAAVIEGMQVRPDWYATWKEPATLWLYLNYTEQGIVAGGGSAAIAASVCASGIGTVGCVAASAVMAGVTVWILENGRCPVTLAVPVITPRYFWMPITTKHCEG
ncbi:hypothetical protein IV500_05540 [Paeniglutamicibacter antarcticus]|uniref:Secreted protein n=1 Tax=Arthrobacter terrae TaxID=2935737 RepID=A0A931G745_9MICC|nr:hypothetical protein [Arthrobacter terrae]MBG0738884.1 hypothetical protein [Arthrobacter terrae]